jgi:hypothetical protein
VRLAKKKNATEFQTLTIKDPTKKKMYQQQKPAQNKFGIT